MAFMFVSVIGGPFLVAVLSLIIGLSTYGERPKRAFVIFGGTLLAVAGGAILFQNEDLGFQLILAGCAVLFLTILTLLKFARENERDGFVWLVRTDLVLLAIMFVALAMFSSFSWSI